MDEDNGFRTWAIMEIMGHRRLGGFVSEESVAGAGLLRIDIPATIEPGDSSVTMTQYYAPSALYCLTPVSEEIARAFAVNNRPVPVQRWELPAPQAEAAIPLQDDEIEYDGEGDLDDDDEDLPDPVPFD